MYVWHSFQVDSDTDKCYTRYEVIDRVERLSAGLRRFGLQKNDIICIIAPNNLDYVIAFYAVIRLGAVFQTANPSYTTG